MTMFMVTEMPGVIVVLVVEALLLGPAVGAVVGMAFSAAARSPARAALGLIGSVVWTVLFGWVIAGAVIGPTGPAAWLCTFLVPAGLLLAVTRRWVPWRLSLLLALTFLIFVAGVATVAEMADGHYDRDDTEWLLLAVGTVIVLVETAAWLALGLSIFEAGMVGESPAVWRRWTRRPIRIAWAPGRRK